MVGEGVLMECLAHPQITEVLSVSRKPTGRTHPKLKEYIVPDFRALQPADAALQGYDACFFCAGVSSVGMKEPEYTRNTYDTTLAFAKALAPSPQMSFVYVSGSGTDSSEKGRLMWARVKGRTENDLAKLPFKRVFLFRPAFMKATAGQQNILAAYKWFAWMFPVLRLVAPGFVNTLREVGLAMIEAARNGYEKAVVTPEDISVLARRAEKNGG